MPGLPACSGWVQGGAVIGSWGGKQVWGQKAVWTGSGFSAPSVPPPRTCPSPDRYSACTPLPSWFPARGAAQRSPSRWEAVPLRPQASPLLRSSYWRQGCAETTFRRLDCSTAVLSMFVRTLLLQCRSRLTVPGS